MHEEDAEEQAGKRGACGAGRGRNPRKGQAGASNGTVRRGTDYPEQMQLMEAVVGRENMFKALRRVESNRDTIERQLAHAERNSLGFEGPYVFANRRASEISGNSVFKRMEAEWRNINQYNLKQGDTKSHDVIVSLSSMELRVALMIKRGFDSEEIARLLHISPDTIKTHRRSIRKKLGIRNSKINLSFCLKF